LKLLSYLPFTVILGLVSSVVSLGASPASSVQARTCHLSRRVVFDALKFRCIIYGERNLSCCGFFLERITRSCILSFNLQLSTSLPARRRPQGLVVIGVCLSVCLCVCAHSVCPQDISRTGSWITTKFGGWEQGVNL